MPPTAASAQERTARGVARRRSKRSKPHPPRQSGTNLAEGTFQLGERKVEIGMRSDAYQLVVPAFAGTTPMMPYDRFLTIVLPLPAPAACRCREMRCRHRQRL